jgi:transposase
MNEKPNPGGLLTPQEIHTRLQGRMRAPSGRPVRQTDVARAQGISPALLGRWPRSALEQAVPSSVERDEIKRLRGELKRVEIERDILKKS